MSLIQSDTREQRESGGPTYRNLKIMTLLQDLG
jgi:hypothetical protein